MARTDDIAGALLETAQAALADIPHADVVPHSFSMQWRTHTPPVLEMRVEGWGPTLHRRQLVWRQNLGAAVLALEEHEAGIDAYDFGASLIDHLTIDDDRFHHHMDAFTIERIAAAFDHVLASVVDVQRRLAAAAAARGIDAPLSRPISASEMRIDQLDISAALAACLVARRGPAATVADLRGNVRQSEDNGHHDDRIEIVGAPGGGFVHGACLVGTSPRLWTKVQAGPVVFDGDTVELDRMIPATVLAAAVGRRVGDVVETGVAALDALVVRDVHHNESIEACDLMVEPDVVRIHDIAALRAHLDPA